MVVEAMRGELQNILDGLNEGIVTCRPDGELVYWNPTALKMHGFSALAEVVGALVRFHDLYELSIPGGAVVPPDAWPMARILRGESIHGLELRVRRVDQDWTRVFHYSGGLTSERGTPALGVLAIVDVTERWDREEALRRSNEALLARNAELEGFVETRTAELHAASKELDSFAYAVSHDLRAPLRALSGFSQALLEDLDDLPPDARENLDEIASAARRMGDLIDGILTLSRCTRGGELRHSEVDLSALALGIRQDLEGDDPDRVVAWDIEPGVRTVGDPSMLAVVLRNLLDNAWKYTSKTADARIRLYRLGADDTPGTERGFCVADNGVGFDMDHSARLFQPFQRLHRQDEFPGIGVGLATVQRILHRHGGSIRADAAPGRGATFTVVLPAPALREP